MRGGSSTAVFDCGFEAPFIGDPAWGETPLGAGAPPPTPLLFAAAPPLIAPPAPPSSALVAADWAMNCA